MERINGRLPLNADSRTPSVFPWTQRSAADMQERMRIIKQACYVNSLAQNRKPDEGPQQHALATSFAYALDNVPTHHLEESFRRAIRAQTDDFLLTAAAVNRAYQDMLPELQRQAQEHAQDEVLRLQAGHGSLGYMGLAEWKERHNLPAAWKLGDPYPPESDLYGRPVPVQREQAYQCIFCQDARWVKDYPQGRPFAKLVPCPECG